MKKMKNRLSISLFILFLLGMTALAYRDSIFRTINLNKGRTITLGEEFSKVDDLFVEAGSGYKLKPGTFGGTKSISIYLTEANRIKSIHFDYEKSTSFDELLGSYSRTLGKPSGRSVLAARSMQADVVFWEDEDTRFELMTRTEREERVVSSGLFDRHSER